MACLTAGDKERAARALRDRPSRQETYSYLAHSTCERLMATTCRGIIGMWRGLRGPNSLLRGRYCEYRPPMATILHRPALATPPAGAVFCQFVPA